MEITLEKIELVKDRTGVSYKEAKEALEKADGSVVDAIISIEETVDVRKSSSKKHWVDETVDRIKAIVRKGNVSKIVITKNGDKIINIPVNVGIVGVLVAHWGMLAATIAAFGLGCKIELVTDEGKVIDVSEKVDGVVTNVKEKGSVVVDEVVAKGTVIVDEVVAKGTETFYDVKEKAPESWEEVKEKGNDAWEEVKEKGTEAFNTVKEVATDKYKEIVNKKDAGFDEIFDDLAEVAEEDLDVEVNIDADLSTEEGVKDASHKVEEALEEAEETLEGITGEDDEIEDDEIKEGTKKFKLFHRK